MSKKDLQSKVHELRELRRFIEELTAEADAITDTIKAQMTTEGVDTLLGDDYKITWREVQSSRFDSKAFKTAMPELYDRFTKPSTTRRFVLA